ncbi:BRCA1 associated RING domain 1 [Balamuthia mandrillaris]
MEQEVTSEQHPGGPEVVEQESERRSIQQQDQKRVETHPKALTQEQELEERKEDADVKQQEQEQIDDKEKPQTSSPMQASDDENLFVLGEWDEQITPSKDASFSLSSQEINSSPLTSSTPSELQSGTPNTGSLLSQLSQISQLSQLADAEAEEELVSEDDEEKQSQQERHVLLPEGMPKQDKFRTTNIATEKVEEREDVNKELRKDVTSDLVNRVDEGEDKAKEDEEEAELSARSPPLSPLLPSQPLSLEESEPGSQLLAPDSQPPILPENFSPLSSPITTSDSGPSLPPPPPNTELESLEEEETRFLDSDKRRKSILTASPSSETSSASVGGRGTEGGSSSKGGNGAKPDKHLRAAFSKWVGGSQLEKILRGAGSHPVDADEQESEEFAETKSPRKAQRENLKETNSRRKPAQTTSDQSKGITSSPPNDKQHSAISEPQLQRHDSSEDFQDAKTPLQKRQRKRTAGTPHSKHKKRERQSRPGGEGSSTSEISEAEDEEEEEEKEGDEDEGGKAANKSRNTPEKRKLSERHEPTEPSSKAARLQTNSTDNSKRDPKMELAVFSPSKAKLSKKSNSYCSLFEPTAEEENKLQRTSEPTKKRRLSMSPPSLRQSTNASKDTPRPSKKQKHPSSSPPDESHEPHKQKKSKEEDGTPVAPNVAVRGYLLSTCLTARQSQIFMAMVRNHPEFKLAKQQWEIQATHLVVGEKKRTVKVLKALALGLWVVSFDWVLESKKAGKWLPEEPFELVTEFPSSMASRLNRTNQAEAPGLFFGKIFYVHRPINTPPETLASLIELSGGVIGQTAAESDYCIRHRDTPNLPPVTEATPRPHTITEATLLDCIVAFRLPHQLA